MKEKQKQPQKMRTFLIMSACFLILTSITIFTYPRVRNLEVEIPDAIIEQEETDSP